MPILSSFIPQRREKINLITWADIIKILPKNLDYPINVWLGGKMARYGQTSENLIFLVEQEGETSTELKLYFEKISRPYKATVSSSWRNEKISAVRIYNEGRLIIDKETLSYTELPKPTKKAPIIKMSDVLPYLPNTVPWQEATYLTGSLVRYGWSGNDIDIMIDSTDTKLFVESKKMFTEIFKCKVDVGNTDMPEREPVYKYKIYEEGRLCHS